MVGLLFVLLIAVIVAAVFYGRRVLRTEKTDAVFGNPERASGGWYWVVTGISSVFVLWLYFSWDAARAFFPEAGNELCQVAKLERSALPVQSFFPNGDGMP